MKRERGTDPPSGKLSREPTPLAADDGAAADSLRAAMDDYGANLDEAAAWKRLAPRLRSRSAPQRLGVYLALGLAAGVAFLLLGKPRHPVDAPPMAVVSPAPAETAVGEPK